MKVLKPGLSGPSRSSSPCHVPQAQQHRPRAFHNLYVRLLLTLEFLIKSFTNPPHSFLFSSFSLNASHISLILITLFPGCVADNQAASSCAADRTNEMNSNYQVGQAAPSLLSVTGGSREPRWRLLLKMTFGSCMCPSVPKCIRGSDTGS